MEADHHLQRKANKQTNKHESFSEISYEPRIFLCAFVCVCVCLSVCEDMVCVYGVHVCVDTVCMRVRVFVQTWLCRREAGACAFRYLTFETGYITEDRHHELEARLGIIQGHPVSFPPGLA